MNARTLRYFTIADVTLLPAFILWFIWQLQFTARWTWTVFVGWMIFSFALHRDTPKTLGWRADNLRSAARQAMLVFGAMIVGLVAIGAGLRAPLHLPPNLISWHRLWSYFAFCLLQQVLLNSLVHNRMLSLVRRQWIAAILTGLIFAACHWPNPVLAPLTLIGVTCVVCLFGLQCNIIPLAVVQAILVSLIFWAFPVAWHHHLRVGPCYYSISPH
jgi:hypothetical protein